MKLKVQKMNNAYIFINNACIYQLDFQFQLCLREKWILTGEKFSLCESIAWAQESFNDHRRFAHRPIGDNVTLCWWPGPPYIKN